MTRERTTTSYAILGLLTLRDWTSYELAKQVQRSLNWFWPRAERKLYDEPKRLVEDGLATATRETTGARSRTVYRVTEPGRDAMQNWLDEPPASRQNEFEGMVKIFFADAGTKEQLINNLDRIENEATQRIETVSEFAVDAMPFPRRLHLRAIGLAMQFEQEDAIRRWARWAKLQVAAWADADDPGDWDAQAVLDSLASGRGPVSPVLPSSG